MPIETLNTILLSILVLFSLIWTVLLILVLRKLLKILSHIENIAGVMDTTATSFLTSALRVGSFALGLVRGFNSGKAITTLEDALEEAPSERRKKNEKRS